MLEKSHGGIVVLKGEGAEAKMLGSDMFEIGYVSRCGVQEAYGPPRCGFSARSATPVGSRVVILTDGGEV